jgi:two-component system LytT family response regulator
MIRTLIVDDEQHCINRLHKLISDYNNKLDIIATSSTVKDALIQAQALKPDLVFLDIEINDKTGFDFLEQIGTYNFKVIFTTAFNNYAIKAFKYSALDYLLKPIDKDDFKNSIERLEKNINASENGLQIKMLLDNLQKENKKRSIRIPTSNGFEILEIIDIIHCEADTSYTYVHTKDDSILVSKPLKYFEELLNDANFFRIHNSSLINIDHVKKYTKGKGGYVTMSNNASLNVSTRRKEAFLNIFN